ncbi:MAG: porin family protein [Epsilonproteobacteria bacterium]|nr:porin family protein [Campylobacterota bacterium]
MRSIKLSIIAISLSLFCYAGGDIYPLDTVYEQEDINLAQEAVVESTPEPVVVEPVVIQEVEPIVKKVKKDDKISPSGFYAGLGITGNRYDSKCNCVGQSGIDNSVGIIGRVGYDFNPYIGIEARGIKSIASDDGASITHTGIFLKPMLPIGDITNIYALLGAAQTKTKGNLQEVDAEGLALGAGVEVDLSKDTPKEGRYSRDFDGKGDQEKGLGLFLDYEKLVVKNNAPDLDTVSAGVTYDF